MDRMPEWKENCESVTFTSEVQTPRDKYRVGTTACFIDKHSKMKMTVADSLENEKITYRTSYSFVRRIDLTYALQLVEKGTKLSCVVDYEMIRWGILGKVLFKLMIMASGNETGRSLENLKSILEGQSSKLNL